VCGEVLDNYFGVDLTLINNPTCTVETAIFTALGGHANQNEFAMEKEGARWCRWSSKPVWGP